MNYKKIQFGEVALDARLAEKDAAHFVEGMKSGAEPLVLDRESYTLLQGLWEAKVLSCLDLDELPQEDAERPFTYATPKPLSPLYQPGHLRGRLSKILFKRLMGISVMDDSHFRRTVEENMLAARELPLIGGRAFQHGADLFSTTLKGEEVEPPRMVTNFTGAEGQVVRVAFLADQMPSQDGGQLVFGEEAMRMYQAIQATHSSNVAAGRGAAYVYKTVRGEELKRY